MNKCLKRIEEYVNEEFIQKEGIKDVTFKFVPIDHTKEIKDLEKEFINMKSEYGDVYIKCLCVNCQKKMKGVKIEDNVIYVKNLKEDER